MTSVSPEHSLSLRRVGHPLFYPVFSPLLSPRAIDGRLCYALPAHSSGVTPVTGMVNFGQRAEGDDNHAFMLRVLTGNIDRCD